MKKIFLDHIYYIIIFMSLGNGHYTSTKGKGAMFVKGGTDKVREGVKGRGRRKVRVSIVLVCR
jgi:hypothetical protein